MVRRVIHSADDGAAHNDMTGSARPQPSWGRSEIVPMSPPQASSPPMARAATAQTGLRNYGLCRFTSVPMPAGLITAHAVTLGCSFGYLKPFTHRKLPVCFRLASGIAHRAVLRYIEWTPPNTACAVRFYSALRLWGG